jgi:formamidopyrimidine-DNA glycosylase
VPELPEVEVVRRGLERELVGRRIDTVSATGARTVRRTSAEAVETGARGRVVASVARRGKYLLVGLDDGATVLVHLRMSGQLRLADTGTPEPPHTHVRFGLDDGRALRFVDPRTFGEVVVVRPGRWADDAPDLLALGPDPLLDRFGPHGLAVRLARRRRVKDLLVDQHVIAGIGNIYADEVLWHARVRFDRPGVLLDAREIRALHRALRRVLGTAVEAGGSTLSDGQYVDVDGRAGRYQERHAVHGRVGRPCPRCRTAVVRSDWGGRSSYWCPRCQNS